MCTGTTRTYTRGRFEPTHGGFWDGHTEERGGKEGEWRGITVSSANHVTAPRRIITCFREVHREKPLVLTHSRFENRSRTTRSRVLQSFALPDEAVELHFILRDTTHNTQPLKHTTTQHTTQNNTNPPTHRPTHHHSPPPPSPLPLPRTRTRKRTCT